MSAHEDVSVKVLYQVKEVLEQPFPKVIFSDEDILVRSLDSELEKAPLTAASNTITEKWIGANHRKRGSPSFSLFFLVESGFRAPR